MSLDILFVYLISLAYSRLVSASSNSNSPILHIVSPLPSSPPPSSTMDMFLSLTINISSLNEVTSSPDNFLVCIDGVERPSLLTLSSKTSCDSTQIYCQSLTEFGAAGSGGIKILPPVEDVTTISYSRVWMQKKSHIIDPVSNYQGKCFASVYLWSNASEAVQVLSKLLSPLENNNKQRCMAASTSAERKSIHSHLSIAYDQLISHGKRDELIDDFDMAKHNIDLAHCLSWNKFPSEVTLRLHYQGLVLPKQQTHLRRYNYVKVPLPFPASYFRLSTLNDAREMLFPIVLEECANYFDLRDKQSSLDASKDKSSETLVGENASDWTVSDCAFDLVEQYSDRIRLACKPLPEVTCSCNREVMSDSDGEIVSEQATFNQYVDGVESSQKETLNHTDGEVDLSVALSCLQLTTPDLVLAYPDDAEAHFMEIQQVLSPWLQHPTQHKPHQYASYSGPWIENEWISHFMHKATFPDLHSANQTYAGASFPCLREVFGPYIPLFLPWTDLWEPQGMRRLPPDLTQSLLRVLRKNVPYITVIQHDSGFHIICDVDLLEEFPNILVLSAGGHGHIPIPLLKQEEPLLRDIGKYIPVQDREFLVSFVGGLHTYEPRGGLAIAMNVEVDKLGEKSLHYYGKEWRDVMVNSKFNLAPRGFGRTAFHLMETLQMGLVPIHVHNKDEGAEIENYPNCLNDDQDINKCIAESKWEYDDESWIPYELLYFQENIGFSVDFSSLKSDWFWRKLNSIETSDITKMEAKIEKLRKEGYFSPRGVMKQIESFMKSTESNVKQHVHRRKVLDQSTSETSAPVSEGKPPWRIATDTSDLVCRKLPLYPRTTTPFVFDHPTTGEVITMKESSICADLMHEPNFY